MTISKTELVKEVKEKITFAITAAIFFSTFIYSFFKSIGTDDLKSNGMVLTWGTGIAFNIASYLLVDLIGKNITRRFFVWIRTSLILGIATFILPILLLAAVSHAPISGDWMLPFKIFLQGSLWMPILTFCLIVFHFDWLAIRYFFKSWARKFR